MNKRLQRLLGRLEHRFEPSFSTCYIDDGSDGNNAGGGSGGDDSGGDGNDGDDGKGGEGGDDKGNKKPTSNLSDAEAKLLKEVMKFKDQAKSANAALQQANDRLKAFDGVDPAELKELLQAKKDAEAAKKAAEEAELAKKGEWDKLKAQMNEAHAAEIKVKDGALAESQATISSLQGQIADLTVGASFTQSSFINEDLSLTPRKTRQLFGSHFSYEDGKVVAYDKPAGAKDRTMLIDGKGEPLAFDVALKKLVDADPDKDSLYKSKMKDGSSSNTDNKNTKVTTRDTGADAPVVGYSKIKGALEAAAKAKK